MGDRHGQHQPERQSKKAMAGENWLKLSISIALIYILNLHAKGDTPLLTETPLRGLIASRRNRMNGDNRSVYSQQPSMRRSLGAETERLSAFSWLAETTMCMGSEGRRTSCVDMYRLLLPCSRALIKSPNSIGNFLP